MSLLARSIIQLAKRGGSIRTLRQCVLNGVGMNSHVTMPFIRGFSDQRPVPDIIPPPEQEKKQDEQQQNTTEKPKESIFSTAVEFVLAGALGYFVIKIGSFLLDFPPICQIVTTLAENSPFLQEHLGTPIVRSLLWWGTVEENYAKISLEVSGPKGAARVDAKALRNSDGSWEVVYLYGALPQFDMRLTDLLPPSQTVNIMPYIPAADDPNAAHHLRGAPAIGVNLPTNTATATEPAQKNQ